MNRLDRFVNLLFIPRFTLQHYVLCAPFCEEANYSKDAILRQGLFLH